MGSRCQRRLWINFKEFIKFAIGAVDMTRQTIFKKFLMKEMEYLDLESKEKFQDKIKPVNFKDPKMKASDNLKNNDNLDTGFFKLSFFISNGKLVLLNL
jgi:hypothetical protein